MLIRLIILTLVIAIILSQSGSEGQIPSPENVTACVTYQGNDTLLNVQWDVMGVFGPSGFFIIKYSSNESDVGFENSIMIRSPDSRNRTNISVPANFTGQQLEVQVTLNLIGRESASAPFIVDIRPVYLDTFEAINSTGNVTTLQLMFNLACGIEKEATCVVDVTPLKINSNLNTSYTQMHNISDEENLFHPQQVILTFSDIMVAVEYIVHGRLLSSEGEMIGPEFQTIISAPSATEATDKPTQAATPIVTTTVIIMSSSETGRPMSSNVIQPTTIDGPPIMETNTTTSMEPTAIISTVPTLARGSASESDNSSSIGIAIGVSVGCILLLVLAITLCIIIMTMKRNDRRKRTSSERSDDYSVPKEVFVSPNTNRYSCSSTTVLHNATAMHERHSAQETTLQKHDYSLPSDTNYVLYEEAPQIGNSKSNNAIPSHYETADNQNIPILPFLPNGHYEMSDTIMYNPGASENTNQTYYSELVHNSHQSNGDIPPVPNGAYYDSLTSTVNTSVQQSDGYTELQESTANKDKPYQSLTNFNNTRLPKFHQYEEVKTDKATIAIDENYSEPYNLKHKKLLPHHEYDTVTGDPHPPRKGSFVREYSEPRDTLNILHH